jgi:hypothetical protein
MGLSRAMACEQMPSIYETRGVLTLGEQPGEPAPKRDETHWFNSPDWDRDD